MQELLTSVLDTLALLLIAAGLASAVFPWIGWACLAVAGVVLLAGSQVAATIARRGVES